MRINLLVIKTNKLHELKTQYEALGLQFDYHNHGNGAFHYATEIDQTVFEIYPLSQQNKKPDSTTRLGFEIKNINQIIPLLHQAKWIIKSEPKKTDYGYIVIIEDLDGRRVELKEV